MSGSVRTSLIVALVLIAALVAPTTAAPEPPTASTRVIVELTAPPATPPPRCAEPKDALLGQAAAAKLELSVVHRLTAAYAVLVVDLPARPSGWPVSAPCTRTRPTR